MPRGSISILEDLDDLLPDSTSRTPTGASSHPVRELSTNGSFSLNPSTPPAGPQASLQPLEPASSDPAGVADEALPREDFRSPLKANVPRSDLEHATQAAVSGASGPLQLLNIHVAVVQPMETSSSGMPMPLKQDAEPAEPGNGPASAQPQEEGAAAFKRSPDSNTPRKEKQPPPSFSFQDIMQRRPGSAGQLAPAHLGKPPLPRLPSKAGLPTLATCAACEALEKQAKELKAQLGSREEELLELDAQCEALEQLVRDREAHVLEIEGIAEEQGLRLQELERAIGEVTAAAAQAASAAAAEKGGAIAELQGRLDEAVRMHAAREKALIAGTENAEARSRTREDQV